MRLQEKIDQKPDYQKLTKEELTEARRQLKSLSGTLETTRTLASDLMKLRTLRMVIDNCKSRLAGLEQQHA